MVRPCCIGKKERGECMKKTVPTETQEQQTLFRWAEMQKGKYPELALLFHISNEGKRNLGRAKAEGIKAGVPDLCLLCVVQIVREDKDDKNV